MLLKIKSGRSTFQMLFRNIIAGTSVYLDLSFRRFYTAFYIAF